MFRAQPKEITLTHISTLPELPIAGNRPGSQRASACQSVFFIARSNRMVSAIRNSSSSRVAARTCIVQIRTGKRACRGQPKAFDPIASQARLFA